MLLSGRSLCYCPLVSIETPSPSVDDVHTCLAQIIFLNFHPYWHVLLAIVVVDYDLGGVS